MFGVENNCRGFDLMAQKMHLKATINNIFFLPAQKDLFDHFLTKNWNHFINNQYKN